MDTPKPIASLRLLHYWSFLFVLSFCIGRTISIVFLYTELS